MEPWTFDNFLVVLKEVNGDDTPEWSGWSFTPFWVQAQNLPIRRISEKVGMRIGDAVGVAIRVWKDQEGRCDRSLLVVNLPAVHRHRKDGGIIIDQWLS